MEKKKTLVGLALLLVISIVIKFNLPADVPVAEESVSDEGEPAIPDSEDGAVTYVLETLDNNLTEIHILGGFEWNAGQSKNLEEAIRSIEAEGNIVGLELIDIHSGQGIAYNEKYPFYSASSIKGPYIISLAARDFQAVEAFEPVIKDVTVASSNDSYWNLQQYFGMSAYEDLCRKAGVSPSNHEGGFTFYSAEELARLWLLCDRYLVSSENGAVVGEWLSEPDTSAIRAVLGDRYATWNKGGWFYEEGSDEHEYHATIDAGIVRAGNNPYVIVVMTDLPAEMEKLEPIVATLDSLHESMIK